MNTPHHVSYGEPVVETLKTAPNFLNEYLAVALKETELSSGSIALLAARAKISTGCLSGAKRPHAGYAVQKPVVVATQALKKKGLLLFLQQ